MTDISAYEGYSGYGPYIRHDIVNYERQKGLHQALNEYLPGFSYRIKRPARRFEVHKSLDTMANNRVTGNRIPGVYKEGGGLQYYGRKRKRRYMSTAQKASAALAIARKLQSNTEVKHIEHTLTVANIAIAGNAGQVQLLNGLVQGDTDVTRTGDKVTWLSISYRFEVDGTASDFLYRWAIIYDRFPQGAALAWTDVYNSANNDALLNYDNAQRRRFVIIATQTLPDSNSYSAKIDHRMIHGFIQMKRNLKTDYSLGNAGTVADMQAGSLYFVHNASGNANAVSAAGFIRLKFTDG